MSTLTDRDVSILTQVAFKESARFYDGTDASVHAFVEAFSTLTDALVAQVKASIAEHVGVVNTTDALMQAAERSLGAELGATPVDGGYNLEVIQTRDGGQEGPLPSWLLADAQSKGVTKVFDNRGKINRGEMSAKAPWFKAPKDQGEHAFWPPRGK